MLNNVDVSVSRFSPYVWMTATNSKLLLKIAMISDELEKSMCSILSKSIGQSILNYCVPG